MTFAENGRAGDDDRLYRTDLSRHSIAVSGFVASGQPGIAALFVYSMRPSAQPQFWAFVDDLAVSTGTQVLSGWMTHRGGNRNLAALICSGVKFPAQWTPSGVNLGR